MMVAQQLYEGIDLKRQGTVGLITYMRTDSTRISADAKAETKDYITEKYGKEYISHRKASGKQGDQDAHEAIRPTKTLRTPDEMKAYLTKDQYRLYKLIWERFVASQMAPAVIDTVAMDIEQNDIKFRANGQSIKFKGFMTLYVESKMKKSKINACRLSKKAKQLLRQTLNLLNTLHNRLQDILKRAWLKRWKNLKSEDLLLMHRRLTPFKSETMLNWKVSGLCRQS